MGNLCHDPHCRLALVALKLTDVHPTDASSTSQLGGTDAGCAARCVDS
jgi:hypothetical protein